MRLLTYRDGIGTRAGVRVDGGVAPTPYSDLLALVRDGTAIVTGAARGIGRAMDGGYTLP